MANENDKAIDTLSKVITCAFEKLIIKAKFDRTYEGIISAVNNDGYTVEYAGTRIRIKTSAVNIYNIGEKVRICIPMGNKRKAYIVVDWDKLVECCVL